MKNKHTLSALVIVIFFSILFAGCSVSKRSSRIRTTMNNDYCIATITSDLTEIGPIYSNPDSLMEHDSLLSSKLSPKEILIANAIGTIPVIRHLLLNLSDTSAAAKINSLELSMQLQEQTLRASAVFDELSSQVSCETERTKRAAGYLDGYEKTRTRNLTIGTIFLGSGMALAPIVIKDGAPQNITIISGAVLSAYLGVQLLRPGRKKVTFTYERNLLADIWFEPRASAEYPGFIWLLLTRKELNIENDGLSIQQNMRKRWTNIELNGADTNTLNLVFKKGGNYSEDNLQTRAILLHQLETSLRLLNAYVQSYMSAIQRKLVR